MDQYFCIADVWQCAQEATDTSMFSFFVVLLSVWNRFDLHLCTSLFLSERERERERECMTDPITTCQQPERSKGNKAQSGRDQSPSTPSHPKSPKSCPKTQAPERPSSSLLTSFFSFSVGYLELMMEKCKVLPPVGVWLTQTQLCSARRG